MTEVSTVVYESSAPVIASERFMAFLTRPVSERDARRKLTGNIVFERLPVCFCAATAQQAVSNALEFWNKERAKEAAKIERGKALAKSRSS